MADRWPDRFQPLSEGSCVVSLFPVVNNVSPLSFLIIDPRWVGRSPRDWVRLRLEAGATTAWSGYAAWWYAVCMFLYFIDYMTTPSAPLDQCCVKG